MRGRVFRRGAGWSYMVDLAPDPATGHRRQKMKGGFKTRREAEAALATVLSDEQTGGHVEAPAAMTVGRWLDEWLVAVGPSLRPATLDGYERAVRNWIKPRMGAVKLSAVTPARLQRFYAELSSDGRQDGVGGLGARSVKLAHTVMHLALERATAWRLIANNPAAVSLNLPRQERKPLTTWTPEEARAFLAANAEHRLYPIWVLYLTTGLRRGEALGLRWEDVNLDTGHLAVVQTLVMAGGEAMISEPKTATGRRSMSLDGATVKALRSHRKAQLEERLAAGGAWADTGLVFTTEIGAWLHPQNLRRAFEAAQKRAKVRPIRIHDLRHTFASTALAAGVHPKVVQEMLGHADVSMTLDIYSHTTAGMHEEAATVVARALFGDTGTGA